mmetsp:Transcript_26822/g.80065  ORF Transcript_26822/g.80065 Transcript_26822/m.80065 type:complete len:315 (+) Transcript_26822:464-1408(+)
MAALLCSPLYRPWKPPMSSCCTKLKRAPGEAEPSRYLPERAPPFRTPYARRETLQWAGAHASASSDSKVRKQRLKSFWMEIGGATPRRRLASTNMQTPKVVSLLRPQCLILPLERSSPMVETTASKPSNVCAPASAFAATYCDSPHFGTHLSGQWIWYRSMCVVCSRLSDASQARRICARVRSASLGAACGSPSSALSRLGGASFLAPARGPTTLVAMTRRSRSLRPASHVPMISSDRPTHFSCTGTGYISAQSRKSPPSSTYFDRISWQSPSSAVIEPIVMVPRQTSHTSNDDEPSVRRRGRACEGMCAAMSD